MTELTENIKLLEDLELENNTLLRKNPDLKEQAIEILTKYINVFKEASESETELVEFNINLKPGAEPIKQKTRHLNTYQLQSLQKQIESWKRKGIIEETVSQWASPLLPVKQKGNPNKIHWVMDYSLLNRLTVDESPQLPNIEAIKGKLSGTRFLSVLHTTLASHPIPVNENTKPLLSFITPLGSFTFNKMPLGVKNVGTVHTKIINKHLQNFHTKWTTAFLEDILIITEDMQEHMKQLNIILEMCKRAGIRLKPTKTKLFKDHIAM